MKEVPHGWRRKSSPESASWVRESSFARDFMSPASTPRPLCGQLSLRRLDSTDLADCGRVEVSAQLTAHAKSDAVLEQVVGRLSLEPTVSAASWSVGPIIE